MRPGSNPSGSAPFTTRKPWLRPELFPSWKTLRAEAQAGDALIKLAAYVSADSTSAGEASAFLQIHESNEHLAVVFDRWKAGGDPALTMWGSHLREHRKGTLVESLVWRRSRAAVLSATAPSALAELLASLTGLR